MTTAANTSAEKKQAETLPDNLRALAELFSKITHQEAPGPDVKAAENLVQKLEAFGGIMDYASSFETTMAGLGVLTSGFQADWIAYFLESFGEKAENRLVSKKDLPAYIKIPIQFLAKVFGIKNEDGTPLTKPEDFTNAQGNLMGAINTSLSSLSLLNIVFRTLPRVISSQPESNQRKGFMYFLSTKILPIINAVLMWASGAGKRHITYAINSIHQNGHKAQTDGAWTSGLQDYLCGTNSLALMLRQAISFFSPRASQILEPILGAWISGSSFAEGMRALRNEEEVADYRLNLFDTASWFGKAFYSTARSISQLFNLELPSVSELEAGIKNPQLLAA